MSTPRIIACSPWAIPVLVGLALIRSASVLETQQQIERALE